METLGLERGTDSKTIKIRGDTMARAKPAVVKMQEAGLTMEIRVK